MFKVFLPVKGHYVEAFAGLPYKFIIKAGSPEIGIYLIHPRFGSDGRELFKKSALFHTLELLLSVYYAKIAIK